MNLEKLEKIGLTFGEIKVYEALLRLGSSTKTPIAKTSGISPGKIYDVLDRLIRKGLVSSVKEEKVRHYKVAHPRRIQEFIFEKKKNLLEEEKIAKELLPELIERYAAKEQELEIEVYKGWKGLETVYAEMISTLSKGEIDYIFGASRGAEPEKTKQFYSAYNKKRTEKGIKVKMIYNTQDKAHLSKYADNIEELRFMDMQTPAEVNIFKGVVVIVILTIIPVAIVIRSTEAFNSFKQYFDSMWKIAKP